MAASGMDSLDGSYFRGAAPAFDPRAIAGILYRNRYLIGAVVAACLLLGVAATLLTARIYRAEASVQIEQRALRVVAAEEIDPSASLEDADRFLETQLDVIRSRYLADRVARELKLIGDRQFLNRMGAEPAAEAAVALDPATRDREAVLEVLRDNLSVRLPRHSRIARIRFDSPDPVLAARIANSFADHFVAATLERKFDASAYARRFLSGEVAEAKARLERSEREMIAYARGARLIDMAGPAEEGRERPRSLTAASLVDLNAAHATAIAARIQAQQRWAEARETPATRLSEVLDNPAIQELVQQRAEQLALYHQERERRREEFPAVRQTAARIAELDRQIDLLASSIKAGLRQDYRVAARQERELDSALTRLKGETLAEQERAVRYNILKRQADNDRHLYESLLRRLGEVGAAAGVAANNVSLLDRADIPTRPVSPKPWLNLLLAGMAGLALALLLMVVRERFDDAIHSPEEAERSLGLPTLGVIPLVAAGGGSLSAALAEPRSTLSESYHAFTTSLELMAGGAMPRTLLFTSSREGEGKTTSACAAGRTFARLGREVLLVDADLRRPSLHRALDRPNARGLSELLAGRCSFEDAVQGGIDLRLDFLSAGARPIDPAGLLASSRLDALLEMAAAYDLIIFDAPPVVGLSDAPLLAARVEGTIFMLEAGRVHRGAAKSALGRLRAGDGRILGAALTKYDARTAGYGNLYRYDYER